MNKLTTGLTGRVGLLALTGLATGYGVGSSGWPGAWGWLSLGLIVLLLQSMSLYRYLTGLNRKLTRFLEAVQYADFSSTFRADNELGPSFAALNRQFNTVLDAFRQTRAEGEANLHLLNTVVQHLRVGVLAFEGSGRVEIVNQTALRLLGLYRLRQLSELQAGHADLVDLLRQSPRPDAVRYRLTNRPSHRGPDLAWPGPSTVELSVRTTRVQLRGRLLTVVSLQNIQPELQEQELIAWQKLTSVLRHEIMNSITPIVSLVGTMRDILDHDLPPGGPASGGALADLHLALATIERRGQGIMQFVDAYRHFTTLPAPNRSRVSVTALLESAVALVQPAARTGQIDLRLHLPAEPLWIQADAGQIEMVLLNLLRNALESLADWPGPVLTVSGYSEQGRPCLTVGDNGPGIEPEAQAKMFIPFFTTKPNGSGIGLSLSRQIMQAHQGQLTIESASGQGCVATLVFGPD